MNIQPRILLAALPYAAYSAMVLFLLPHAYDAKGRLPAIWPDWCWLDTVAVMIVWSGTSLLLARVDRRRRHCDPAQLNPDEKTLEFHALAFSALKATGYMWLFAIIRWLLPSSRWGTRAQGMSYFSLDASEYQFLVFLWVAGFLFLGFQDLAGIPGPAVPTGGRLRKNAAPAGTRYHDPDWITLRHLLLEARAGQVVAIPEHLKSSPTAQLIITFLATGDAGLLDQAAQELTGNTVDPWGILTGGAK